MGKRLAHGLELAHIVLCISVTGCILGSSQLAPTDYSQYCPWLFADEHANAWQRVHSGSEAPGLGTLDQLMHCWGPKTVNSTQRFPLIAGASLLSGNDESAGRWTSETNIFFFMGSCWQSDQLIPYRSFLLQLSAEKPSWRLLSTKDEPRDRWGFSLCSDTRKVSVVLHGGMFDTSAVGQNGAEKSCVGDTWVFDSDQLEWLRLQTGGVTYNCRAFHAAASLDPETDNDQQVMMAFGGCLDASSGVACKPSDKLSVLTWNKTSLRGTWTEVSRSSVKAAWPSARRSPLAATTVRGTILLFGGISLIADFNSTLGRNSYQRMSGLRDLWEFNPQTKQWTLLVNSVPELADHCPSYYFSYHTSTDLLFFMCEQYGSRPKEDEKIWVYNLNGTSKQGESQFIKPIIPSTFSMFRWLSTTASDGNIYIIGYNEGYRNDITWKFTYDPIHSPQGLWSAEYTDETTPDPLFLGALSQGGDSSDIFYTGGQIGSTINAPRMLAKFQVWLYVPYRNTWSALENPLAVPPTPRFGHTIAVMPFSQQTIFLFGGIARNGSMSESDISVLDAKLWCFDVPTSLWKTHQAASTAAYRPDARVFGVSAMVNGVLFVHGGLQCLGDVCEGPRDIMLSPTVDVFSPSKEPLSCGGQWESLNCSGPTLPTLFGHTAVSFGNYALIFGGASYNGTNLVLHQSLWMLQFNTTGNCSWSLLNQSAIYPPAMYFHSAARMLTKMVISGGCLCTDPDCVWLLISHPPQACASRSINLDHVWLFDTVTLQWTRIALALSLTPLSMHVSFAVGNIFFALGGMGNATSTSAAQLPSELSMRHRQYAVGLACPPGTYSTDIVRNACSPCPVDTYSEDAGLTNCTSCPMHLHTRGTGAVSRGDCDECYGSETCHGNGFCSVDASQKLTCRCHFGFTRYDQCRVPYYYIVIATSLIVIACLVVLLSRAIHRRRQQRHQFAHQLSMTRSQVAQLASAWRIDPDELSLKSRLDSEQRGAFGEVWLAQYRDMPVAVKRLQAFHIQSRSRLEFEREARVMRTIRHPNIVLFLGAGFDGDCPFLVLEYMQRGTLYGVLRESKVHIDTYQEVKFAIDIAKGMRYLHGLDPPRIHRDLKTGNLLVSEKWVVKVGDFGAARLVSSLCEQQATEAQSPCEDDDDTLLLASAEIEEDVPLLSAEASMTRHTGTILYCAPEVLLSKAYGAPADVYSFGVILWEIRSRSDPFSEFDNLQFLMQIVDAVTDGCRPTLPPNCPSGWASLIQDCWQVASNQRPTFRKIVDRLLMIQNDVESFHIIPSLGSDDSQRQASHQGFSANRESRDVLSGDDSDL